MNKKFVVYVVFFMIQLFPITAKAKTFGDLYIFGDSISDMGNLASVEGRLPGPFFKNRKSNGRLAVEVLAEMLGADVNASFHLTGPPAGTNFAVDGARARDVTRDDRLETDLLEQIDAFLADNNHVAPSDALYLLFIGSNDVRDAIFAAINSRPDVADMIINDAVDSIGNNVLELAAAGARFVMVVNAADVGSAPLTKIFAGEVGGGEAIIALATEMSRMFNVRLSDRLGEIKKSDAVDIVEFDLFIFFQEILTNQKALGFTNAEDPCFFWEVIELKGTFHPGCDAENNIDAFIFFDELHPTARVHERAGRAFFSLVPEP